MVLKMEFTQFTIRKTMNVFLEKFSCDSLRGKEDGLVLAGVTPLVTVPSLVHLP